jgi:hypothetical protein
MRDYFSTKPGRRLTADGKEKDQVKRQKEKGKKRQGINFQASNPK